MAKEVKMPPSAKQARATLRRNQRCQVRFGIGIKVNDKESI